MNTMGGQLLYGFVRTSLMSKNLDKVIFLFGKNFSGVDDRLSSVPLKRNSLLCFLNISILNKDKPRRFALLVAGFKYPFILSVSTYSRNISFPVILAPLVIVGANEM